MLPLERRCLTLIRALPGDNSKNLGFGQAGRMIT
jgi:hypothetical protein